MDAASVYFRHRLGTLIEEKQTEMMKRLMQGVAVDFADYKERAGYLKGLADVIDWMNQINMQDEQREMRP
jgi:hypothetical protein